MGGIRFNTTARDVIGASAEKARALRHDYVGTEHLLLGLIAITPELLGGSAVREELETRVYAKVGRPRSRSARRRSHAPPYTSLAKRALELAMTRARLRGRSTVEPEDLLHGLVEEEVGLGGRVLRQAGHDAVVGRPTRSVVDPERVLTLIALDDAAHTPYHEQLTEQIKALIAQGRVLPGDRLPPVRRLADHLDVAPGTVARVYSRLEEEGVVETAGRSGTSVAFPSGRASPDTATRRDELVGLLRPVAVAAFHLGATSKELFEALRRASEDVFDTPPDGNAGSV